MYSFKGIGVSLAGLLFIVFMTTVNGQKTQRFATGVWGGPHISIEVGAHSATVEYDCAHGAIEGPLVIDSAGKFHLRGTFTAERGGPVRAGAASREQPATYTGEIKDNTMTLTLKVGDSEDTENFTLEKDKQGKLVKCK